MTIQRFIRSSVSLVAISALTIALVEPAFLIMPTNGLPIKGIAVP